MLHNQSQQQAAAAILICESNLSLRLVFDSAFLQIPSS